MQKPITNNVGICLPLAVWAVHDDYDYVDGVENYISATTLMKPIRQLVLAKRVPTEQQTLDVVDLIASSLGSALHDSIEKAWVHGYAKNLAKLGYPKSVIDRIRINPTEAQLKEQDNVIPIYIEQRATREIDGYTIGGKFDLVAEGVLHDNKSTSAYTWVYGGKDQDYAIQGSIYRWLNPEKITEDFTRINFIFTDWQKTMAKSNPAYPQQRLAAKDVPLLSIEATEAWIRARLAMLNRFKDAPQEDLPECTDEELWRSAPVYKYFSDPSKTQGRSTKNFEDIDEANAFAASKGKGVVITVPGVAKRCEYCACSSICTQYARMQQE